MRPTRTRSNPQKTLVGFVLGDVHYAIDIARVLQIVRPLAMTVLPHLPEGLVGVAEHRGEVVPVVDLRVRFGLAHTETTRHTKWVLLALGNQPVALVVDGITDVFGTSGGELRPAPGLGGDEQRGILGVINFAGRLTFVLDVERLRGVVAALPPGTSMLPPGGPRTPSLGPKT